MAFFESIYNSFLSLSYVLIILIVSIIITIITTLIYKYTTDQKKLKKNKEVIKELRDKMKKNKNNQKKMMEIQQEMMSKNMEMMKSSFKPMLYTFIPLILLFSWMTGTLAYEPLMPNQPFTITATLAETYTGEYSDINVTSVPEMKITYDDKFFPEKEGLKQARWVVTPEKEGQYTFLLEGDTFKQTKEVIVSNKKNYENPLAEYKDSQLKSVTIGNKPVKPFEGVPILGGLSWLWSYVLLSVLTSIIVRKAMKIA